MAEKIILSEEEQKVILCSFLKMAEFMRQGENYFHAMNEAIISIQKSIDSLPTELFKEEKEDPK